MLVAFGLRPFPICFISLDFIFKPIHLSTKVACFLNFQILNLTFIGPCIVIYFYSKTNYMPQCLKFVLLE